MPGRPREHVLEEESFIALRALLPAAWTLEQVRRDYGLDARVEVFEDGSATGLAFWAQLKATDEGAVKRALSVSFATTTLNYLSVQADPVLLVRFHAPSGRLFGTWLHRHDVRLKRAGQKSLSVRWKLSEELDAESPARLLEEVRRFRRIGSAAHLPLTVALHTAESIAALRSTVVALLRATIQAAHARLKLVSDESADLVLSLDHNKVAVDTPLATLRAESERTVDSVELADNAAVALATGLVAIGLASPAVDLVVRCRDAPLLRNDDVGGRLAPAFGTAGKWREASDLALDCLSGRPGRETLGRLLDMQLLLAEPSQAEAEHIAGNLVELASRQQSAGENAGAAWYSAGNWLFHSVRDYPAALRAYETAAKVRPDYRSQSYWLEETAAAKFETGDFPGAARLYGQAAGDLGNAAPSLLAKTADCLAHTGDRQGAAALFDRYVKAEHKPAAPWLLKRLALQAIDFAMESSQSAESSSGSQTPSALDAAEPNLTDDIRATGVAHNEEGSRAASAPDWSLLVHSGLRARELLRRFVQAEDDATALLAVLTAACAFPEAQTNEPWAALLHLAWALREEHEASWALPGQIFQAALDTAIHRRGDDLLRDLLSKGGDALPIQLVQEVEDRAAHLATRRTRTVFVRAVGEDGSREVLEIGLAPSKAD
jgi:tetratricopeptide (TPR) repeat protein